VVILADRWRRDYCAALGLFNPDTGEFDVEIAASRRTSRLNLTPLLASGHDPQLEKAVAVALQDLKDHPAPPSSARNILSNNWPAVRSAASSQNKAGGQN